MTSNKTGFPSGKLVNWYRSHRRQLPWRESPTPYRVWVSEIMLQQTQVKNVLPYYLRFIKSFPTLASLARAKEQEVLRVWSGLGYYSRARNMLITAKILSAKKQAELPDDYESLIRLPGIGPYTAGALLSIAYNRPQALLDGNVRRVLSRFYITKFDKKLWDKARKIVSESFLSGIQPSDLNQSLMELGALVCLPQDPLCGICPVRSHCHAEKSNLQSSYPPAPKKQNTVKKRFATAILFKNRKFLVTRRSSQERWLKELWELPMVEFHMNGNGKPRLKILEKRFSARLGAAVSIEKELGHFTHSITRHRLKILVYQGTVENAKTNDGTKWITSLDIKQLSTSSILPKALVLFR